MKQFFISLLATITGIVISVILLVIIFVAIVAGLAASVETDKPYTVKNNSVLHITLNESITERTTKNPFEGVSFMNTQKAMGLDDIKANLKKAKEDDKIKGIFMELDLQGAGMATLEEVRNALLDFKKSGKFIMSYSEIYTQKDYYLASVADKVIVNPQGIIEWKGLSGQVMFYKGMLDKLEVDVQIFRHGKFKSATEPFFLDKMSAANREQTMTYVNTLWNHMVDNIAQSRKITSVMLNNMADSMLVQNAATAVKYHLADEMKYKDEVLADLRKKLGLKENAKIEYAEFAKYARSSNKNKINKSKDNIAIVYAVGEIAGGEGDDQTIGSERISEAIRTARLDSTVKAIVLRVNSPGGSALASDVIWREVLMAKKEKPVVVSMGDVAASGGYYIACAADAIVAQPNTITGSIGVFGILPNAQKLFNNKLGITIDTVNSNKHSDIGSIYRPVSKDEGVVIQNGVEDIYNTFVSRVAEGRKMTTAEVDSIGQGRVWSGVDGKRIGLVDELGGIDKAIEMAAAKAKLKEYKIKNLPIQKDPIQELVKELTGDVRLKMVKWEMGEETYQYYKHMKDMMNLKGVQARMPYDLLVY